MKFKFALFLFLSTIQIGFAQIVTTSPSFPTENDSIIVYFDATKSGAEALLNYTGTLYTHTGVTTNVGKWQHVIGTWGDNTIQPALTRLGQNLYQLTIGHPRQFYGITNSSEHITELDFVFRSSDAAKQTSPDIYYSLYQSNSYSIVLQSPGYSNSYGDPQRSPVFVNPTDTLNIIAKAIALGTKNSSITLFINGTQKAQTNTDSLDYKFFAANYPSSVNQILIIGKDTSNFADTLKLTVMINSQVIKQALPAGNQLGINYNSPTSVTFALFAPYKKFVYLLGDFNDWKVDPNYFMKEDSVRADSVTWWITLNNLTPGQEYAFQYLVDGQIRIADPFSNKILDPDYDQSINSTPPGNIVYPNLKSYPYNKTSEIVSVLQTNQQPYNWQITNFKRPGKTNLVIYELHVRDFVSTHWFKTVEDTLNYLKQLGINAIELMPVMEFEGNDSWGYNPDFHMALDKYYGTPDAFKSLIDKAHSMGIAVILDIVLNHAYGECPLVRLYWNASAGTVALNNPWFNAVSPNPVYSFGYDFNHESAQTKYFVDRVNSYWINEFHIDGFRFDFAKGFTNTPGEGTSYDAKRIPIIQRMGSKIWSIDSTAILILENFVDNSEEIVESNFGFLSWGNMNYNYNEATMGFNQPGHSDVSQAYYINRGWPKPSLVSYMESHDEERLMYKNLQYGNRSPYYNTKDLPTALSRIKEASAFFFTIPGPKMIWQFGELGYDYSINYNGRVGDKPIRWDYYNDPNRMTLYKTMAALIKLRNNYPVFQGNAVMNVADSMKSISFSDSSMKVNIIGNFSVYQGSIDPNFKTTGTWFDYFSGDSITVTSQHAAIQLGPGEFHIYTNVKLPLPDLSILTDVKNEPDGVVNNFKLEQNYPNPFNPTTTIRFTIPDVETTRQVVSTTLKIYDILGREITTLVNEEKKPGSYQVTFNPANFELASGVYFYQLRADNFVSTKKMLYLK